MIYFQHSKNFRLVFSKSGDLYIFGYTESVFPGSIDDMKPTSLYEFKMAGGTIKTKKADNNCFFHNEDKFCCML